MKHFSREVLWELGAGEASADQVAQIESHLELCASCRELRSEVDMARCVLAALPKGDPPLPRPLRRSRRESRHRTAQSARKHMACRADESVESSLRVCSRHRVHHCHRLAMEHGGTTSAHLATANDTLRRCESNEAHRSTRSIGRLEPTKALGHCSRATRARVGESRATADQILEEGSVVTTEAMGSLSLQLPDGSRAKLQPTSQVTLTTIEAKVLRLDLEKGSLALNVPHRDNRILTVIAAIQKSATWAPSSSSQGESAKF